MSKLIISFAGGGVRGLASITFLAKLEKKLMAETGKSIFDTFDMFAGTSIGGVIAVSISTLKISAAALEEYFTDKIILTMMPQSFKTKLPIIFQLSPKYDGIGKRLVFSNLFKIYAGRDDVYLNSCEKKAFVTSYGVESRSAEILKSYDQRRILALDAVDATTAAPVYYPSAKIEMDYGPIKRNTFLIDGSVVCNKPTMLSYLEAKSLWPDEEIKVLAIGTGVLVKPIDGPKSRTFGAMDWIKNGLLDIVFDETLVHQEAIKFIGKNYMRINSELPPNAGHDIDDVDPKNLNIFRSLGASWFDTFGDAAVAFIKDCS